LNCAGEREVALCALAIVDTFSRFSPTIDVRHWFLSLDADKKLED